MTFFGQNVRYKHQVHLHDAKIQLLYAWLFRNNFLLKAWTPLKFFYLTQLLTFGRDVSIAPACDYEAYRKLPPL